MSLFRSLIVLLACAWLGACGPNLGGLEKGEVARVASVPGPERIELDNGMLVLLAEIDAPDERAPYYREAVAELEALASARKVRLAYGGAKRLPARASNPAETADAEPREVAIAHVFVQSEGGRWVWLQHELIARGAAYVRPRRDNHARAGQLLAVEAQARAEKLGLWALSDYAVLSPAAAIEAARLANTNCRAARAPYRLVEGRIADAQMGERRAELTFAGSPPRIRPESAPERAPESAPAAADENDEDQVRGPFSIVVFGAAFADWDGPPLFSMKGERVRARGALGLYRNGPQLCLDRAEQLEVLAES